MATDEPSELETCQNLLDSWTDSLEELSEIEEAFADDGKIDLNGKTVLDIGTDCVKPLYMALKFNPSKIVGIDEGLPNIASGIMVKSKFLTDTKIQFYDCSFLDDSSLDKVLKKGKTRKFNVVLVSKTLHHLRTGECVRSERGGKHDCKKDRTEKDCVYRFDEQEVFSRLLAFGDRVVIYEYFYPDSDDDDKVRGRGGYFTADEWKRIFGYLCGNYRVVFVKPQHFTLDKDSMSRLDLMLRKVDRVCFYLEKADQRNCGDRPDE
ncbi:MAG: hypothetical protein ABSA75_14790 [Candidatus Bathyarchaeia archaeon]|jgi:hypothetical protein